MAIFLIALSILEATIAAMAFEWLWAQQFVQNHTKLKACRAYWLILCIASLICTSAVPAITILTLAGIAYAHVDLVSRTPDTPITPKALCRNLVKKLQRGYHRFRP